MRAALRQTIPSMFHRRLLLLVLCAAAVCAVLGAQTARLGSGPRHLESREAAENALRSPRLIPTVRGRILDRHGRLLAVDEPGWDVAVDYAVIAGDWAYRRGREAAFETNRSVWNELTAMEKAALVAEHQEPFDQQVEMLWRTLAELGGTSVAEIERQKSLITRRVQNVASHLWDRWREQREAELDEPVSWAEVAEPIGEQRQAHSVLSDIRESTRVQVNSFIAEAERDPALAVWAQVELRRPRQRRYPSETLVVPVDRSHLPGPLRAEAVEQVTVQGVGVHLVGAMREVWKEDVDRRPFGLTEPGGRGGYLPGDEVGRFGVEASMEDRLRGTRGRVIRRLDTGEETRVDPVPGGDVRLTLDIVLQARVQAIMSPRIGLMQTQPWHHIDAEAQGRVGRPLNGAAVVLDVNTSEVLAAVSLPAMPLETLRTDPDAIYQNEIEQPYLNRVVQRPYQPGSTVKPIVLASAGGAGVLAPGEEIFCDGHLDPGHPDRFRCWIFKQYFSRHGPLAADEAIARSCNIFFYTLGRRLGPERLVDWYGRFGFGRETGAGLEQEFGGNLPGSDDPATVGEATLMGIGQGPIDVTPLQLAGAYATLARGGVYTPPTLIHDDDRFEPRPRTDLRLPRAFVEAGMSGLDQAVNASYGTGHALSLLDRAPIFDAQGVKVLGKSGTAQAVPQRLDTDGDGRITTDDPIVKSGDHAWFVALVQPEGASRPTHVITVIVEFAGSGGQVAGPIVNQIIHAMKAEGYLP